MRIIHNARERIDKPDETNYSDREDYRRCSNCREWVQDQERICLVGRWFCSDRCKERWVEEKAHESERYRQIEGVYDKWINVNDEKLVTEIGNVIEK